MKRIAVTFISILIFFFFAGVTLAQDPIVFPAKGQSQDQMEKDKFSCYQWAKNETGFDPMQTPTASTPPPQQQAGRGGAVKGAAVGAGAGALIKRSGSRSKGAGTGAVVGGVLGGARQSQQNRQDQQARQQWEQQQANEYAQKRNTYNRAFGACMESKGYSVK
jgi:outer membrane lipoprotein SlyB